MQHPDKLAAGVSSRLEGSSNTLGAESPTLSRRATLTMLAMSPWMLSASSATPSPGIDTALTAQYALMRRAYQTTDAESLRRFYAKDIVIATEGAPALIGLESVVSFAHTILEKRSDITAEVLRAAYSAQHDIAHHIVKLTVFSRNAADLPRVLTGFLLWQLEPSGWRCSVEVLMLADIVL